MFKMEKEKKWVAYGGWPGARYPSGIGRILRDSDGSPHIVYSDQQLFFPDLWSKEYVRKFNSLVGAVGFYVKENGNNFDNRKYIKSFCHSFPDERKSIESFLEKTKKFKNI